MIQALGLTKIFGRTRAVDNLSFEVAQGEIVGFLGPNGAGKTTTMRMLTGYLSATGGTIKIAGMDVFSNSLKVRRQMGYLPENVAFYPEMRVVEYLRYRGRLKGVHGRRLRQRLDSVLESCGLGDVRRTVIGRLSKGFRQRLALADCLIHEPPLLILDEPTIGLDPNQIRHVRNLIRGLGKRHTILLCSHILSEVEMMCERVLILKQGRIVAADRTEKLVGLMRGRSRIDIEVKAPAAAVEACLAGIAGVEHVSIREAGEWVSAMCECGAGMDLRETMHAAIQANRWALRELRMEKRNLEDVFVEITADQTAAADKAPEQGI